jgi:hypothetical protein
MAKRKSKQEDLPKGATEIYKNILAIEARKGENSEFPNEEFRHDFSRGAKVYGLKNGSILIKSDTGKRLWGEFGYWGNRISDVGEEENE